MTVTAFTQNYTDHSNETGYQFEFFCDKCGNGYRSSFVQNNVGVAASMLHAAGSIFGGILSSAGSGADYVGDAMRGKQWDEAFANAIAEIRPRFRQCPRCGQWVCPQVCWNEPRGLCMECAPDLHREAAAIQAEVAADQLREKAAQADLTGGIDFNQQQVAACPHCNARVEGGGKFCSTCGKPLASSNACRKCGAQLSGSARFCAECGTPR